MNKTDRGLNNILSKEMFRGWISWVQKHPLRAILLLSFLHGLIYVFMIPPWWHHEEPGHFEYAWLVANREEWPKGKDYDNDLRREIALTLIQSEHGNFWNVSEKNLDDDPIWIGGYNIPSDLPPYPWLVSRGLILVRDQPVLVQLYAARLLSLTLFVFTIWIAWLFMAELVEPADKLQWGVPLFLALLPGYVDNMTSVHDDVIASVAAFLFLWLSVRLLKRRWNWLLILGWGVSVLFCYYARETSRLLVLVAPLVILFRLFAKKTVLVMSMVVVGGIFLSSGALLKFEDASQWYSYPATDNPNRTRFSQAPYGEYVFSLPASNTEEVILGQSFSLATMKSYRNKLVTLGVWAWADSETTITLPVLYYRISNKVIHSDIHQTEVGTIPSFQTITFEIPYDAGHTWLTLSSSVSKENQHVYYDGFVLAEGNFSDALPPVFGSDTLTDGIWNGHRFDNLIRNPSAEHAWLSFKPIVNKVYKKRYLNAPLILATIQDWKGFGWYYKIVSSLLFQEFWGRGAGTQAPLIGHSIYIFLQFITLLSIIGFGIFIYRSPRSFIKKESFILAIVLGIVWSATIVRGVFAMFDDILIVPYTRFAYPAFIPTALILCIGILEVLGWICSKLGILTKHLGALFGSFLAGLSIYALFSFGGYFYPWILNAGYLVFFLFLIGVIFVLFVRVSAYD